MRIFILCAKGDETTAETLVHPLKEIGYTTFVESEILAGESFIGEVEKVLREGGPVVLCGTCRAIGNRTVLRLLNAVKADPQNRVRLYFARMEAEADVEKHSFDIKICELWQDSAGEMDNLIKAIQKHYPLPKIEVAKVDAGIDRLFADQPRNSLVLAFKDALPGSLVEQHPWRER